MFGSEKTSVFWLGLIILGLASIALFSTLWYTMVTSQLPYVIDWGFLVLPVLLTIVFIFIRERPWTFRAGVVIVVSASTVLFSTLWTAVFYRSLNDSRFIVQEVPSIVGAVTFMLIGRYMMKSGTRNKEEVKTQLLTGRSIDLVAALTMLGSFILGFFAFFLLAAFAIGSHQADQPSSFPSLPFLLWSLPYMILPVYAFFVSVALFASTSKHVWAASIVFWVLTIMFYTHLNYLLAGSSLGFFWFELILIPSIVCLAYFQTSRVRRFFHLS